MSKNNTNNLRSSLLELNMSQIRVVSQNCKYILCSDVSGSILWFTDLWNAAIQMIR